MDAFNSLKYKKMNCLKQKQNIDLNLWMINIKQLMLRMFKKIRIKMIKYNLIMKHKIRLMMYHKIKVLMDYKIKLLIQNIYLKFM